jgi:hypothetical protein
VTVTDGRLTSPPAAGRRTTRSIFIEVSPADAQTPIVTVTAPTTNASGERPDQSRVHRHAQRRDDRQPSTVYFTIGGSAGNGTDYGVINSPVTIPAGSSSMTVNVNPVDDPSVEGTETVTLTLASQIGYTIGASSNATIRINDNDTPVGNTITWTTKAANPLGRAEALRAVVDGKLYVFGGFGSDGPVNRP